MVEGFQGTWRPSSTMDWGADTYDYELIHRLRNIFMLMQCQEDHVPTFWRTWRQSFQRKKKEKWGKCYSSDDKTTKEDPCQYRCREQLVVFSGFEHGRIRASQQADPVLSQIFDWVKGRQTSYSQISHEGHAVKFYWSQFDSLRIINGVVIREIHSSTGVKRQILLATDLRDEALVECHSVITAGHFGQRKLS